MTDSTPGSHAGQLQTPDHCIADFCLIPVGGESVALSRAERGNVGDKQKKKREREKEGERERERGKETDSAPVIAVGLADRIGLAADRRRAAADATKPFDVFDAFGRHNSG